MKVKNMTVLASMVLLYSAQGMASNLISVQQTLTSIPLNLPSFLLVQEVPAAQVALGVQEER